MIDERPNYYAVIPASVRYDSRLKPNEKLLYGEITALSNKTGLCYATNKYFSELYEVSVETISRYISHLKELDYIDTELEYKNDSMEIEKRIIIIDGIPIDKKVNTYVPNNQGGIDKKVKENNTSINNKKKIYKRKDFVAPTLDEIQKYCLERKNDVDAKKFYDYYSVSDWKDKDGNPVKNWKQKIITWERDNSKVVKNKETVKIVDSKIHEENGIKFKYDEHGKRVIL